MEGSILVSVVGRTDPVRSEHDGPILHIIRHYHPERVVLLLTDEIEKQESAYHYNEEAIHLLNEQSGKHCSVELVKTGIRDAQSYDEFPLVFLRICGGVRKNNPGKKILLNITSGTPQMETALCMIALSDPGTYVPLQVFTPENSSNRSALFDPRKDLIEDWFEQDIDNEPSAPCRCHIPELLNFKRPVVQFQIESLIRNYDYSGAFQLYQDNQKDFSQETGLLLEHAKKRVNMEYAEAERIAKQLGRSAELYPVQNSGIKRLMEYYLSVWIKQRRGERIDMALRLEVLTKETAVYFLEKCLRVPLERITTQNRKSKVSYLSEEKCEKEFPGIGAYLDEEFGQTKSGGFEWGNPVSGRVMVHIVKFACKNEKYGRYRDAADELIRWSELSGEVRNPAAHEIVAITEDRIRETYGKSSSELCRSVQTVLMQAFGSQGRREYFAIYDRINEIIKEVLEQS